MKDLFNPKLIETNFIFKDRKVIVKTMKSYVENVANVSIIKLPILLIIFNTNCNHGYDRKFLKCRELPRKLSSPYLCKCMSFFICLNLRKVKFLFSFNVVL